MEPSTLSIQYQSAELNPAYEKDLLTYQSFRPVKLIALYYNWEPVKTEKENRVLTDTADWRTVAGALPLFPGHFQPRLPGELGYYDARVPAILQRQVELATGAGIHGFCFDIPTASAFNSKKDLEIRFCLRDFSNPVYPDSPVNISSDQLIAIFSDERYIRIEKKPLILVKNQYVCKQWRKLAAKIRPDGFFIVMTTENLESVHLQHAGCDGILDLPPFNFNSLPATTESGKIYPGFRGKHFIYSDIINQSLTLETLDITCFRGVFPAWDNTALKRTPDIVLGSSPELFQEWLSSMMDWTLRNNPPDKQLLFINAWNDWSNGCYLEPDRAYGYGYLNATVRAFHSIKNSAVYEK
jgi:hypothetical protein